MMKEKARARFSLVMVLLFVLSLVLPVFHPMQQVEAAEGPEPQTLGDLQIGDRVVDNSWEWEHKTGNNYTGVGETKSVTWIVVAKDHYSGGDAGSVAGAVEHVTLLSEEIIAKHAFDDSTDRNGIEEPEINWDSGSNRWDLSGTTDAEHGMRPFLNSMDKNDYAYAGEGFYNAFSSGFKKAVVTTTLPNKIWNGAYYSTVDKVFLPTHTELGFDTTPVLGDLFDFFADAVNEDRIANLGADPQLYYTRSPGWTNYYQVRIVMTTGGSATTHALYGTRGVRPAVNMLSDVRVAETEEEGLYEIIIPQPIGDLQIGDRVVDNSWEWEHKTGNNYTGFGETKPVTWIVVGKDHFDVEGVKSPVTLLSEDIIGRYKFDDSANRNDEDGQFWDRGSSHWGASGTPNAQYGQRPFLNDLFYSAFSEKFQNAILTTKVPNSTKFNNDWEWIVEGEWITYDTFDQVFILSTAELGDTANLEPVVGSRLPYFDGDEEVVNDRRALDTFYSTRTPLTNIEIRHIANNGNFSQGIADNQFRVRPALNISDDIIVSPTPNDDGAYVILSTMPDAGNSGITGMEKGIPGSKAVTLTITVENIAGEGFTGYTETDFSFSIEGADSIDFTDAAFSEFTDNDDGTYTVTFTGEEDDTAYIFTALTVSGVLIQDTAEITTPRPCPLTEGDGSKETPFLIYNAEQLNSMRYYPDKHFKLMDVIDLENAAQEGWDYDEEKGWEPVGPDDDNPFTGTLDGNGHTISNLFIDRSDPGEEHYGLFGYIDGATLKNVHLVNVNVTGEDSVGTLAGEAAPFSVINNCSATGNVSGNQRVGGLVGYNYGYITKSYASATVTGHGGGDSDTGGLVGWNKGDIINSYALGPVSSVNFVGGLVGYNGDGKIQNSYSSGTVEGDCCVGGLVGDSGSAMNSYYDTDACGLSDVRGIPKSTLAMKFEETFTGWDFDEIWAIGYEDNGTFYRTYPYLRGMDYEEYPGQEIPGSVSGMVTLDGEGDLTGSTVTLLDEDEDFLPLRVTVEEEDGTYIIEGIPIGTYNLVARNPGFEKGTVEDTEVVGGEDTDGINFELSAIANTGSISGTVTDVDTGDSIEDARVYLYYDGTLYEAFTGADGSYTLNSVPVTEPEGDGYTVTASATRFSTESEEGEGVKVGIGEEIELNFTLTRYFDEGLGTEAFPYIITDADHLNNARYYLNDHTVHFRVESDIDLNASPYKDGAGWEPIGTEEDPFNGTFDGNGHTISNLFIDRDGTDNVGLFGYAGLFASIKNTCLVDADITGWDYVGGLVGDNLGSVKDCSVTGEGSSVSGDCCVGGLVGDNKGSVTNSHATADVTSSCCYAGGLVGYNNGGHISNSYAGGEVSGCCEVGGLVGYNDNGYVNNCYATGTVTGNCCFGGLVGDNTGIVSNSYYNSETSGQDDDDRGTPKTTAQMKNPQIFTGWNFDTIWTINEGSTYPYLQWQTDNFDFAPPIFAEGYPQPGSRTYESIELLVKADEDATAYYVVLLEGMDAPDALQVRDGQDGNGEPAENGNFPLTAYTVASTRIEGLLQETDYDIYVVAEDTSGNLQPDDYMGIIKNVSTVKPPSAANSEITGWTKGNPGSRQVTIDILLKDDGEGALPGYIYTDFTVSVEGDAPVNFAGESFSGFTDNGDGTYSVIYIGEEDETSYTLTDLTVAEVIIHDTEEITTPRPCPLTEGDGSELNPFLIYNADQLNSMRYHLDKHFRIAADIDLEEYLAEEGPGHNEGAGWEPVGTEEEPFTGTLDGNGYSINNLFINRPLADYVGLFGYTDSSTINNVCLVEVDVSGRNNVGGLVGYNSGNINNSKVAGEVNCFWVAGGGMAGSNDGGSINHSYADVIVNGEVRAGGLVGLNNGEIIGSYALGVVESGCCEVGGLVGYNEGNIEDCYATGEVNGL